MALTDKRKACSPCSILKQGCAQDCVFREAFPQSQMDDYLTVLAVFGSRKNIETQLRKAPADKLLYTAECLLREAIARQENIGGTWAKILHLEDEVNTLKNLAERETIVALDLLKVNEDEIVFEKTLFDEDCIGQNIFLISLKKENGGICSMPQFEDKRVCEVDAQGVKLEDIVLRITNLDGDLVLVGGSDYLKKYHLGVGDKIQIIRIFFHQE